MPKVCPTASRRPGSHAPGETPARRARPRLARAASALACAALAAGAAAGCGGSGKTLGGPDPASAVPAGTPIFLGADVRPSGAEKDAALAAGRTLTGRQDPYLRLLDLLRTPGSGPLDFGRDVAPWLGARAGVFLSSLASAGALEPIARAGLLGSGGSVAFPFGAKGVQGALVMDATDTGRARSFLQAQASRAGAAAAAYRGVAYRLTPSGIAFGVVHGFAVVGSDSGLRAVVDTVLGGTPLARAPDYGALTGRAPSGAVAHLYVNPTLTSAGGAAGGAGGAGLLALLAGSRETNISLVPAARSLAVVVDSRVAAGTSTPGGLLAAGVEGTHALEELPGNSWLAVGLAHLGATLSKDAAGVRELAALVKSAATSGGAGTGNGIINLNEALEGLLSPIAALAADTPQAERDFTSWMGSAGLFASGSGLLELKAGLVIESKDAVRSRAAVGKLGAALARAGDSVERTTLPGTEAAIGVKVNGLPVVLDIAAGRDAAGHAKLVVGLGEDSISSALSPSNTLASASTTGTAASALGEGGRPSIVIDVRTLVGLLEALGLTEDPTLGQATPYLRAITTISGGGHTLGGGVERFKLLAQLR